ncbi:hypothetical protein HY768_03470 [candidate division TA06 bacterium]|uniref:Uncharacterized protein n=1 Tax=candidate division TA06 bacterium TaxID=2250710 RepID=A0A933ID48_UNCT6|nr:hypothetical protein [candidate division TA06 bacterium]
MIEKKKKLAQSVIGAGESWLTELSTEELRRVSSFSPGRWGSNIVG